MAKATLRLYVVTKNKYKGRKSTWSGVYKFVKAFLLSLIRASGYVLFLILISWGLIAGYRWLTETSIFTVKEIAINGCSHLENRQILRRIGVRKGFNIWDLSISSIRARLKKEPWVKEAWVKRNLPDELYIKIQEKVPVFLVRKKGRVYYSDAQGRVIAPVRAGSFISLPFLSWDTGNQEQKSSLDSIRDRFSQNDFPVSMDEVAWIDFHREGLIDIFLYDRDLLLCIGNSNLESNLFNLARVWKNLTGNDQLSQVQRIIALEDKCWVQIKGLEKRVSN